jgi:exportin-1
MNNTSHSDHYNNVKETIRNIAKINYKSFSNIIQQKVDNVMCFENYITLNSVCWTIGTISGCSVDDNEKKFLVSCLRTLLNMTDKAPNINSKSQIASLILYIVGAYPGFINKSVQFLMCVLNKIFEFMKNRYDGVREMAVNTFRVLCEKCAEKLIKIEDIFKSKENGNPGFKLEVWDFLTDSQSITEKLSLAHKIVYFEAIGHLFGNIKNDEILVYCINNTLTPLMEGWSQLIQQGGSNI